MLSATARRRYQMVARARSAEETGARILDAADRLFGRLPYDQVTLSSVAHESGTTTQTVMRRFGSKERLFVEVGEARGRLIRSAREEAHSGNVEEAVRAVFDNYERWGDVIMHLLGQEPRVPEVSRGLERGRRYHREWVERIFEPLLPRLSAAERELRLAQLAVVTDLYSWKQLRRDMDLDRTAAQLCMRQMVVAMLRA